MGEREKNIVIIHYNTPKLTECLVKSINRYMSDAKITIFDNSDTQPFVYKCPNLSVIDNTKGKIIDFEKFLKKYPNRNKSNGRVNNFASAKHCYTVEKLIDMFDEGFVLLDSDTIVKKDLSDLFDDSVIYAAKVVTQPSSTIKRVLPFICYINTKMCKELNVHYFNENYMHGLRFTKNNRTGDLYDTGSWFYLNAKKVKAKHVDINIDDYVSHYGHGSWKKKGEEKELTVREWLYANKEHWLGKNKKVLYTCVTNGYDTLKDPKFITMDFDYVCFTDDKTMKSDMWDIRPLPKECADIPANKKQRLVKILPHLTLKDYDLSIWVDGNVEICGDLDEFIRENASDKMCSVFIPEHPKRDCIYAEERAVLTARKDVASNTNPQIAKYKKEGFPKHYGLVQSNIIVRRHNYNGCRKLMEAWFKEIKEHSHRDQLSFNYVLWKNEGIKMTYLDKTTDNSKWFKWRMTHKKDPKKKVVARTVKRVVQKAPEKKKEIVQIGKFRGIRNRPSTITLWK